MGVGRRMKKQGPPAPLDEYFFPSFFFLRAVTASSTEGIKGGVLVYICAL
jgi:hypothetical protein